MKLHPLTKGIVFTAFVPGSVVGWVPWLIDQQWHIPLPVGHLFPGWLGFFPVAAGAAIYLWCAWDFAITGRGTPAAFDPPKRLIARGLYKCVRNPMYIGLLLVLIGQSIWYDSVAVLAFAFVSALTFHAFILLHEEPHLSRNFGNEYLVYAETVNRWIPNCGKRRAKKTAPMEPF